MQHNDALLQDLRRVLASPSPALLIEAASALAALQPAEPGPDGSHTHELQDLMTVITQLAPTLVSAADPETNAVLRVWAEMLGDDMLRRRVFHSVSKRDHPAWLDNLPHTRVTRAISFGDPFGEEETLMLEVQIGALSFTLACAVRHLGGSCLEDAYLLSTSIAGAFEDIPPEVAETVVRRERPLPEAQQLLAEALEVSDQTFPPFESDSWPITRPAFEWFLRLMPAPPTHLQAVEDPWLGDLGHAEGGHRDPEVARVADAFAQSLEGRRLPPEMRNDAYFVFLFQSTHGTGDLMRWGPQFVEALMLDLYPRKILAPDQVLLRLPRLLSAIVTWANTTSGVAPSRTNMVLRLIKKLSPEYRNLVRERHINPLTQMWAGMPTSVPGFPDGSIPGDLFPSDHRAGDSHAGDHRAGRHLSIADLADADPSAAELQRADVQSADFLDPDFFADPSFSADRALVQFVRFQLEDEAGGPEELAELDTTPLRIDTFDEVLDSYEVPEDLHPKLRKIAAIVTKVGGKFFHDTELVSVAVRVLVASATWDPAVYRRRAKDEITAAAVCWIAGRNNRWFSAYDRPERSVKALVTAFGLTSSPQQRGITILRAMGAHEPYRAQDLNIGDPEFLTAARRAMIIAERDALPPA
ncbi:hypothetical protein JOF28_001665 [Leucobacter exalbidus]|uniref:Uncharacterized protein n=1 Tax=Leucobacter exalbidus TaxID=662960 RepID=A0A940T427_9MICO|nr:hypothetical protein [Leucobacter exalbidus]MBP1326433.1 hypothetical protein [Leucobacter exalbidus]